VTRAFFFDLPPVGNPLAGQSGWLRAIHSMATPTTKAAKAIIISNSWFTIIDLLLFGA
tara:strand:- start:1169 stop:1342 length:174 start_codon:yes stop_codon:yes gene_type:complete